MNGLTIIFTVSIVAAVFFCIFVIHSIKADSKEEADRKKHIEKMSAQVVEYLERFGIKATAKSGVISAYDGGDINKANLLFSMGAISVGGDEYTLWIK